jgi:hypothetical protein
MRHREPRAVELTGNVDRETAIPLFGRDLVHLAGRPRDAGIVHQHVETFQFGQRLLEQPRDLSAVGHVASRARGLRVALRQRAQRLLLDVADMHPGALGEERTGDLEPDAACAGCHQDLQVLDAEIHVASES